jgi:hypothetical protein
MYNIKLTMKPALPLVAAFSLFIISCQKKFDPSSYAPVESFGGYTASNDIAPSNLVAHFSFESSLVDSVSNTSATGTGTSFSNGIKGQALTIGLNNYAVFTPTTAIRQLQSMTLAFWVNTPEDAAGIQTPVDFVDSTQFWGNFDTYFDGQSPTGATFKIHSFGSAGAQEVFLTNWNLVNPWNAWVHLAITYDATANRFTLYANGTQVGTSVVNNFGPLNFANFPAMVFGTIQFMTTPSLTSGATSQPWASFLLGELDEVRIYNSPLAASDIKALYQLEKLGR